jgi:hypothetical protein
MKVKLNPMFEQASGQLGELVFRKVRGQTIAGRKPSFTADPTDDQIAHREQFKKAVAFGKSVMTDSSLRAFYEVAAQSRNIPLFALTVADYFNKPTITSADISTYNGKLGDKILIAAMDDFGVVKVQVNLLDSDGMVLETGQAVETPADSGHWVYTGKTSFPINTELDVEIVDTDRPGGSATVVKHVLVAS